MILNALTIFHAVLSLIGIGSGAVAIYGLLKANARSMDAAIGIRAAIAKPQRGLVP